MSLAKQILTAILDGSEDVMDTVIDLLHDAHVLAEAKACQLSEVKGTDHDGYDLDAYDGAAAAIEDILTHLEDAQEEAVLSE